MIYTVNNAATQPEAAYGGINKYFEPDYVSGQMPPVNFMFIPFTIVIDLDTMQVLARGPSVTLQQVQNLVAGAND